MSRFVFRSTVVLALPFLAMACSGGGGDGTGPDPAFTMSVSPSALTLTPPAPFIAMDATGNVAVNVTRSGGFEGAVTVTVEGLPAGVTAGSLTIPTGSTSGSLTLTAGPTAAAGASTITIRGSASGLTARTTTLSLTVTVPPSIGLTLSPSSLTIEQGQSGSTTANIVRAGGFSGNVTLSSSGGHAQMTVQFNPALVSGATSNVTVGVGAGVPAGVHTITIQAGGSGVANVTAELTVTVTPAATPGISIAASPNALTIAAGANASTTVNITRVNFTGAVAFTSSGGATGIDVQFDPASTTGNSSTLTVTVGPSVAPGVHTITVTGTAGELPVANNDLTITVPAPAASIAIALSPPSLSIQQGGNASTTVNITRTNFTGDVELTHSNTPANVSVDFAPALASGTSSTATVTVGGAVTPGIYEITIHASGTGVSDATTQLTLTVASSGGGGNVTFTFCAQSGFPLWLAYRNEGGSWTQVAGSGGTYAFTINPRGTVAWVMPAGGGQTELHIAYGSTIELTGRGGAFCVASGGTKTINGSVAGLGAAELAQVYLGKSSGSVFGAFPMPFVLNNVEDGVLDLIATRSAVGAPGLAANSIIIQRNLNPPDNSSLGALNFATGVTPTIQTATVTNLGADHVMASAMFMSRNGTAATVSTVMPSASTTQVWRGVPSTEDGDFHMQNLSATPAGVLTGFPYRSVTRFDRSAADRTYGLPPFVNSAPTFTFNGTAPYVTLTTSWTVEGDFDDFWSLNLTPASGSVSAVVINGGAGYFGNGGPVQLAVEAFGAGFNPVWGLQPGISLDWVFTANGGPAWANGYRLAPTEGAIALSAGLTGTIVP